MRGVDLRLEVRKIPHCSMTGKTDPRGFQTESQRREAVTGNQLSPQTAEDSGKHICDFG